MRKLSRNGMILLALLTACLLIAIPAAAEPETGSGVFDLGTMVVTGCSEEDAMLISTNEIIDIEDLKINNSSSVGEALDTLPGVFPTIGTKNEHHFTIRGFDQIYVPIFYDGIPISVPNEGYVDAGVLSTGNLSRITVSKGVTSVLYGADAMGGVINLVSRVPERPFEGDITLGGQEVDGYKAAINLGTRQEKWYMALGANIFDQRTFKLSHDFEDARNESGSTRSNAEVKNKTGSCKIGWLPREGHEYALGLNVVDAEREVPPHTFARSGRELKYWRFNDWNKLTTYFIGNSRLAEKLDLKTRIFRDDYENTLDSYDDDTYSTQNTRRAFHSRYDDYSWGGSMTLCSDEQLDRHKLSLACHYKFDVHKEQDNYGKPWERYESETWSFGLEDNIRITDDLSLVLGLAYDLQNPRYADGGKVRTTNDAWNPQIGLNWALGEQTIIHAAAGYKSRFPTLMELYASYLGSAIPNTDLKKEQAVNYEIGIEHEISGHTHLSLTFFYSDIDDLIVRRKLLAGDMYDNIGKARHQGLETSITTTFLPRQEIVAHYTFLDAENRSPGRRNNHLENLSRHKVFIADTIKITDIISLHGKYEWYDDRWEEDTRGNWTEIDGFALFDAKIMLQLPHQVEIEAGFRNLFDKDYELSVGFPRPGRTAFAEMRYSF